VGDSDELSHSYDATLLDFLIDVLLLELDQDTSVELLNNHCELRIQVSCAILQVVDEHTNHSQGVAHYS